MLKVDEEGQMLILRKYFCYIFSNANGMEKPSIC